MINLHIVLNAGTNSKKKITDAVWPEFPETDPYNQDGFYNDDSVNSNEENIKENTEENPQEQDSAEEQSADIPQEEEDSSFPGLLITTGRHMRILTKR